MSEEKRPPCNTFNKFCVGCVGDKITILRPPTGPISHDDARNLAAWLSALSYEAVGPTVAELTEAIENL